MSSGRVGLGKRPFLTEFEAIAIAEKYAKEQT
jgi:hypothetical protein